MQTTALEAVAGLAENAQQQVLQVKLAAITEEERAALTVIAEAGQMQLEAVFAGLLAKQCKREKPCKT